MECTAYLLLVLTGATPITKSIADIHAGVKVLGYFINENDTH